MSPRATVAGSGRIAAEQVAGASALVAAWGSDPLKILPIRSRGVAAWACITTYGGGLLAGDRIALELEVAPGSRLLLTSQASTKIFRSSGLISDMTITARVAAGGLLVSLPEPICPFATARYRQQVHLDLAEGASLIWLDSVTAGRSTRGEHWAADSLEFGLEVTRNGRPILIDRFELSPVSGLEAISAIATIIAIGPLAAPIAAALLASADPPGDRHPTLLLISNALPAATDGVILRLAAADTQSATRVLRTALAGCAELVGAEPFAGR
ncbi:hypothetical protein LBMAG53_04890 [Planctomycetota bacterium]|nr:hypothetical protein LBMAG53_04890 [Planctomycetota bacterium]